MNDHGQRKTDESFADTVGKKETRRIEARSKKNRGIWFGMGMFGLVGWAVAIPTLIGIAIGVWVDQEVAGPYSWTLMGLFIGVIVGCLNAWYWVNRESGRE
jgi:ATP synthase protein I